MLYFDVDIYLKMNTSYQFFLSRDLTDRFKATGIPTLIVVTQDGQLITNNGRSEVTEKGTKVFQQWLSATLAPSIASDCQEYIDR